jgi:hypothetical protein
MSENGWDTNLSDPMSFDILLHKLHGSVTWARTETGRYVKLTQKGNDGKIILMTNETAVPLILYPGKKLEYIEPTLELLQLLKKSLTEVKCCFVVGYKFSDEHISKLFRYSASRNEDLIVFLISPSAHSIYFEKLKRHTDEDFKHGFMHENFTSKSFNITISTDLEGRVICLPYKFQVIFPWLLQYYEQLKKGREFDLRLRNSSGMLDPLVAHFYGEYMGEYTQTFNLIDCLFCFKECEYFDRIDTIIEERTNGWHSVISRVAEVDHARKYLLNIYDILLKRYFNHLTSQKANLSSDLLKAYLLVSPANVDINVKDYQVSLKLRVGDTWIEGYFGYTIFEHLEKKFQFYSHISEVSPQEILNPIGRGKSFFERWKDGPVSLDSYLEKFTISGSNDYVNITNHRGQLGTGTPANAQEHNRRIGQIILQIERGRL